MHRARTAFVFACVLAAVAASPRAQTLEELKSTVDEMSRKMSSMQSRLDDLGRQNQVLQGSLEEVRAGADSAADQRLEAQINALAMRRLDGVTVNSAANPVSLYGEFRFRMTGVAGDNTNLVAGNASLEHDGWYTDSLLRLGFDYEFTNDVSAFAELQAHWAFGDGAPTTNSNAFATTGSVFQFNNEPTTFTRIHQSYIQLKNIFGSEGLSMRLGRQEIILGKQFQFGNADWFNGFSFDALLARFENEDVRITGIVSKLASDDRDTNQLPSYFNPHDDDELYVLYFTLKVIDNHELDFYWIHVNGHGTEGFGSGTSNGSHALTPLVGSPFGGNAYYHNLGLRFGGVFPEVASGLDWNVEGIYQFGDADEVSGTPVTVNHRNIDGATVEGEVGLTFCAECKFRVYTRVLWADSDFIPLYGSRHSNDEQFRARYGLHDLFPMTNVFTVQLGMHFDPSEDWTLGLTGLWAETDDLVAPIIPDAEYGYELDLWGVYRHSQHLSFSGGLALVFPGDALILTDGETQFLAYFQARLLF